MDVSTLLSSGQPGGVWDKTPSFDPSNGTTESFTYTVSGSGAKKKPALNHRVHDITCVCGQPGPGVASPLAHTYRAEKKCLQNTVKHNPGRVRQLSGNNLQHPGTKRFF